MYCRNCGERLEEGFNVCPNCGALIKYRRPSDSRSGDDSGNGRQNSGPDNAGQYPEPVSDRTNPRPVYERQDNRYYQYDKRTADNRYSNVPPNNRGGFTNKEDENDDPTAGKKKAVKRIIRVMALIAMVCFFCPLYMVSCGTQEVVSPSGLDLTFGFECMGEEIEGFLGIGVLFVLPLFSFLFSFTKAERKGREEHEEAAKTAGYGGAICSGTALLAIWYISTSFADNIENNLIGISPRAALMFMIASNAIAVIAGTYLGYLSEKWESGGNRTAVSLLKSIGKICAGSLLCFMVVVYVLNEGELRPSTNPEDYDMSEDILTEDENQEAIDGEDSYDAQNDSDNAVQEDKYALLDEFISLICSYSDPPDLEDEELTNYFKGEFDSWLSGDGYKNIIKDSSGHLVIPDHTAEYTGSWMDTYSERCSMEISSEDGINYNIDINWGSSAWENTHWSFQGTYDEDAGSIHYYGSRIEEYYPDGGEKQENYAYTDGEGLIWLGDDGMLYWNDYVDDQGAECSFKRSEY